MTSGRPQPSVSVQTCEHRNAMVTSRRATESPACGARPLGGGPGGPAGLESPPPRGHGQGRPSVAARRRVTPAFPTDLRRLLGAVPDPPLWGSGEPRAAPTQAQASWGGLLAHGRALLNSVARLPLPAPWPMRITHTRFKCHWALSSRTPAQMVPAPSGRPAPSGIRATGPVPRRSASTREHRQAGPLPGLPTRRLIVAHSAWRPQTLVSLAWRLLRALVPGRPGGARQVLAPSAPEGTAVPAGGLHAASCLRPLALVMGPMGPGPWAARAAGLDCARQLGLPLGPGPASRLGRAGLRGAAEAQCRREWRERLTVSRSRSPGPGRSSRTRSWPAR